MSTATDIAFDVRDARLTADPIIAAAKAADRRVDRDNRDTVGLLLGLGSLMFRQVHGL